MEQSAREASLVTGGMAGTCLAEVTPASLRSVGLQGEENLHFPITGLWSGVAGDQLLKCIYSCVCGVLIWV